MFGWTVAGSVKGVPTSTSACLRAVPVKDGSLEFIQQFWALEAVPGEDSNLTAINLRVMDYFEETTTRDKDGRYHVSLPRKDPAPALGESQFTALQRYKQNQKSLEKKGTWEAFQENLQEYLQLDHAEEVPPAEVDRPVGDVYYLPMHGITKESSTTTKLRMVVDASAKSSTGVSLNDMLQPGPSLYPLLPTVITWFRMNIVGVSTDIFKMFRDIGLQPGDRDLHRFLLATEGGVVIDHRMKRLTFGVTSSPFLATRVLQQVAKDYHAEFPRAAKTIKESFMLMIAWRERTQSRKQSLCVLSSISCCRREG